ncbi:MAG TPA: tetratricopeptide repeat protein, partial [Candidatus Ozemobacteraceae bacterium]|nr:tetratricopeptide repeat protein [Candidatus Ozemobacteraceae bacterium]
PNFLAAFLMSTALVTCGLLRYDDTASSSTRVALGISFLVQLTTLLLTKCAGALLCFLLGLSMFWWRFWEVPTRRWFRLSPFLAGILLSALLISLYGIFSIAARHYPWESLSKTPWEHLAFVTRVLEFHMGFSLFLQHPLSGLGPGASPYLLASLRPPLGHLLGLASFNEDPHSLALTLLSETGLFGLFAFCSLIAAGFGIHRWHRYRHTPHLPSGEGIPTPMHQTSPLSTELPVVFAVPAISLLLHALFNNTLSILPLALHLLLLTACHQASCLREVQWYRHINWMRLPWLPVIPLFLVTGWSLEHNHQVEARLLFAGQQAADNSRYDEAEQAFAAVLNANQQSLRGLFGLAISQERQGRLAQAQDLLGKLDQLSPNVFGVRLHLSRIFLERRQLLEAHRWALLHLQWSQSPAAYELLGRILLLEGRLQEAEQVFQEGLFHVPVQREDEVRAADRMRLLLGELALDRGEMETARHFLQSLTTTEATSPAALFLLGRLNFDAGLTSEALLFFEKAYKSDPKDARIGNALGYLLSEMNRDLPRARGILEQAYQQYKDQAAPRLQDILSVTHSLGMLYARIGEVAKARELLTLAFDQTPVDWRAAKEARAQDLNRFLASLASPAASPVASSTPAGKEP